MARWKIIFFPVSGERNSPGDYINYLSNIQEKNLIDRRLRLIRELESADWPYWVKKVRGIYQLTAKDHRVYFELDANDLIVVTHVCRKTTQKAREQDIRIAKENFDRYHKEKEERNARDGKRNI